MKHSLNNRSNSQAISEKTHENDYAGQSGYTKHAQLTELQVRRKKIHTALTLTQFCWEAPWDYTELRIACVSQLRLRVWILESNSPEKLLAKQVWPTWCNWKVPKEKVTTIAKPMKLNRKVFSAWRCVPKATEKLQEARPLLTHAKKIKSSTHSHGRSKRLSAEAWKIAC